MQPSLSPIPPERRGRTTLVVLLVVGLLVVSTIAVVEYFQLRSANERIAELEAGGQGGDGDGGIFGDFDELIEDLLGDTEGLLEGVGDIGGLIECLGSSIAGGGDAGTTVPEIAAQVEQIRELEFVDEVEPEFVSPEEMSERVRELFLEEYTPEIADVEQRLLTTLGAIPPGTDLRELRANAIGQQVAGYYEPETGELVVMQTGSEPSAIDRITLSHELDHALTDQALGIPLPDDPDTGREDANLAALALVEGDATAVMQRYSASLSFDEQFELLDPAAIAASEAGLENFPYYLEQELLFPYEEGLTFVCDLFANGGWASVDRAYEQPPASTAQVLFPERYTAGVEPVDPPDPPAPGKGWEKTATLQLGAANLLWLFSAPGGDTSEALPDPRAAVSGWRGGEIHLWARGPETAAGIALAQPASSSALCDSVIEWYGRSFDDDGPATAPPSVELALDGERQDGMVDCDGAEIRLGLAPDLKAAESLISG